MSQFKEAMSDTPKVEACHREDIWELAKELERELAEAKNAAKTWENEAERRSRRYEKSEAENAALLADAERYRWLANHGNGVVIQAGATKESLDAAIDAARKT